MEEQKFLKLTSHASDTIYSVYISLREHSQPLIDIIYRAL